MKRQRPSRMLPWLMAGLIAALPLASAPALAQQAKKMQRAAKPATGPQPADVDKNGVIILVKSALMALDQANKTGNYTVLRDLGSVSFQANTAARLAEIFAPQRTQKVDLSGIVLLEPQLTLLPQIEANGMLHMAGFFPSAPTQVHFELLWEPVNREWRLFGLSVNLAPGGPKAPDTPPPPPIVPAEPPSAPTGSVLPEQEQKPKG